MHKSRLREYKTSAIFVPICQLLKSIYSMNQSSYLVQATLWKKSHVFRRSEFPHQSIKIGHTLKI
jgi:hypothetical protein